MRNSANRSRGTKLALSIVVVALFGALLSSSANAQAVDPTGEQYNSTLTQISTGFDPPSSSGAAPSGSLPFTGLDIAAMALAALALAGAGVAMKRHHTRLGSENTAG